MQAQERQRAERSFAESELKASALTSLACAVPEVDLLELESRLGGWEMQKAWSKGPRIPVRWVQEV